MNCDDPTGVAYGNPGSNIDCLVEGGSTPLLPFTGTELGLIVFVAFLLLLMGVGLYRLSQNRG